MIVVRMYDARLADSPPEIEQKFIELGSAQRYVNLLLARHFPEHKHLTIPRVPFQDIYEDVEIVVVEET